MVWEQPKRQGLMQRPALRLGGYQPPSTVEPATTRSVAGPNETTPSADSRAPHGTGRRSTPGRWHRGRRRTRTRTRSSRSTRMTPTQTGRCTAGRRGSHTGGPASRSTPTRVARDTHSTDSSTVRHPLPTPSCGRTCSYTDQPKLCRPHQSSLYRKLASIRS